MPLSYLFEILFENGLTYVFTKIYEHLDCGKNNPFCEEKLPGGEIWVGITPRTAKDLTLIKQCPDNLCENLKEH